MTTLEVALLEEHHARDLRSTERLVSLAMRVGLAECDRLRAEVDLYRRAREIFLPDALKGVPWREAHKLKAFVRLGGFVSPPEVLRCCLRCKHRECPCCAGGGRLVRYANGDHGLGWCDSILCITADDPDDRKPGAVLSEDGNVATWPDGASGDRRCADEGCRYDRPVDPRLLGFLSVTRSLDLGLDILQERTADGSLWAMDERTKEKLDALDGREEDDGESGEGGKGDDVYNDGDEVKGGG